MQRALLFLATCILISPLVSCSRAPSEQRLKTTFEEETEKYLKETPADRKARWGQEAEEDVRKECTNAVVGLNRIIDVMLDSQDSSPRQWRAIAVVEFVNRVGGVERTNLDLKFTIYTNRMTDGVHVGAYVPYKPGIVVP